ncbi:MAG: hypothetical protein K940chlam2_00727 [Chlamydiae bacterium]|nr:hypothetical protein [Chlamydiota bacterium]
MGAPKLEIMLPKLMGAGSDALSSLLIRCEATSLKIRSGSSDNSQQGGCELDGGCTDISIPLFAFDNFNAIANLFQVKGNSASVWFLRRFKVFLEELELADHHLRGFWELEEAEHDLMQI